MSAAIERRGQALPSLEKAKALLDEAQEILAHAWADFNGLPQPDGLEWALARAGKFPPTEEEMSNWTPKDREARGGRLVYFIAGDRSGLIKIGCADDPRGRLADLQCGSPVKLTLVGTVEGGREKERALHKQFASVRRHGEWFGACDELIELIRAEAQTT